MAGALAARGRTHKSTPAAVADGEVSTMSTFDELRLIRQSIAALKQRTITDLDALAAQVDLLLPQEESDRGRAFKRYTPEDWGNYLDGSEKKIAARCRSHKFKIIG